MAAERPKALLVTLYQVSRRGHFSHGREEAGFALAWTDDGLALKHGGDDASASKDDASAGKGAIVALPWQHVTAVWTSLRCRKQVGFFLDVTFETSHPACELDFFRVTAAMDDSAGAFLKFLQAAHIGRLKDGRAPNFATSRWAGCLYSSGGTVRCVRLWLGRLSTLLEVIFSACFFTQLHSTLVVREQRLTTALTALQSELSDMYMDFLTNFVGEISGFQAVNVAWRLISHAPYVFVMTTWRLAVHTSNWFTLLMLLQHLFMVMASVDAMWRTVYGTVKSAMSMHKAAAKATRAIKRTATSEKKP